MNVGDFQRPTVKMVYIMVTLSVAEQGLKAVIHL